MVTRYLAHQLTSLRSVLRGALCLGLAVAFLAVMTIDAEAQSKRSGDTVYIKLGTGLASYSLDADDVADIPQAEQFDLDDELPLTFFGELGYQFSPSFGVGLGYQYGEYVLVNEGLPVQGTTRNQVEMHLAQLLGQYTIQAEEWTVAPYIQGGVNLAFSNLSFLGETPRTTFGPTAGVGLDVAVSDRLSLFVEGKLNFRFTDEPEDGVSDRWGSEAMRALPGAGLKFNFRSAQNPVEVVQLIVPDELETNEEGVFEARVNEDADEPLDFQWDYGDGTTDAGLMASKSYMEEGTYEVTFTVEGPHNVASETAEVTVVPAPVPAGIVSVSATPMPATAGEEVEFTSNVEGDEPLDYEWSFGDGTSSTEETPTHVYDEPGEYEVTLNLSNPHGEDTRTMDLEVEPALPAICTEVTEFNAAFFDRNSSELTDDGREALDENAEILADCPNLDVGVEGFASERERDADQLSDDRAQAVAAYYEDMGIDPARIDAEGMGAQAVDKADDEEFRRADSTPVDAE